MSLHRDEPTQERLYSFANFYFAGIHAGIQTSHTVARMSQKYAMTEGFVNLADPHELDAGELFNAWAKRGGGETIIVKNGGMQGDLYNLLDFLKSEEHPYPFDFFNESQYAANSALTNVSIVLPPTLWKLADAIRAGQDVVYTSASNTSYVFYNAETDKFSPMNVDQDPTCDEYLVSRRENMIAAERKQRSPGCFPGEQLLTFNKFDMELITRMNRSGLM